MPKLYNITNWNPQPWFSTGGTRSKKYVQNPENGKYYYFKRSYKTQGRDYFFEFWSEVAATDVGLLLGFDMLRYDIALDNDDMGCISESMISAEGEELIEGGKYLQAFDNRFDPNVRELRGLYSFQLIVRSLDAFKMGGYIEQLIEIIVFDALIGNSDRHQENWAFINIISLFPGAMKELETGLKSGRFDQFPDWFKNSKLFKKILDYERKELKPEAKIVKLYLQKTKGFAPIYDSGSSLGRELTDKKVISILKNEQEFEAYLNRGVSEIHWKDQKLNHFELINQLLQSSYAEIVLKVIERVKERFDAASVEKFVFEMDNAVPEELKRFKLPEERKRLMVKLITSRFERLKGLGNERI